MPTKTNAIKRRRSFEWIKARDTAKTYLCPIGVFGPGGDVDGEEVDDEELRRHCVDESSNPHND
jgi:hypothetical protein